jgi:hypothetical protein
MTYTEKLKDPRWQKKRLEKLNEARWACQGCGREDITLHVHHLEYKKGAAPWEYEADELRVFCADCHETAEEVKRNFASFLAFVPPEGLHGLSCDVHLLMEFMGEAEAVELLSYFIRNRGGWLHPVRHQMENRYGPTCLHGDGI